MMYSMLYGSREPERRHYHNRDEGGIMIRFYHLMFLLGFFVLASTPSSSMQVSAYGQSPGKPVVHVGKKHVNREHPAARNAIHAKPGVAHKSVVKPVSVSSVDHRVPLRRDPFSLTVTASRDASAADASSSPATASGDTTLRSAIEFSNAIGIIDTIFVPAAVYTVSLGQIYVGAASLVIKGAGESQTVVDGGGNSSIFELYAADSITILDLTIRDGYAASSSGGGIVIDDGSIVLDSVSVVANRAGLLAGGIRVNGGTLTMTNCRVDSNSATGAAGGVQAYSNLILRNCTFTNNSTTVGDGGFGGAVETEDADVMIDSCIFKHNYADLTSGALDIEVGTASVTNCIIDSNSSGGDGGAFYISASGCNFAGNFIRWNQAGNGSAGGGEILAPITMRNCFVGYNSAIHAGGIWLNSMTPGSDSLIDVTIVGNTVSGQGGGLLNDRNPVYLMDACVDSNSAGSGGGVYDGVGGINWDRGSISYNTASGGGGIFFDAGENDTLFSVSMLNNAPDDIYNNTGGSCQIVLYYTANELAATHVTRTSAIMNGLVLPENGTLTVEFQYGTASGHYTNDVPATPGSVTGSGVDSVKALLSGLSTGTIYYYRVLAFSTSPADTFTSDETSFQTIPTGAANTLKFKANSDYAVIPYRSELNPSGDFTVELWARADTAVGDFQSALTSRGYFTGLVFYESPDYMGPDWQFWFGNGGGWITIEGDPVQIGQWTHLAAVYQSGMFTFYINGDCAGCDGSGFTINPDQPIYLGCGNNGGPWFFFDGAISEVRLWSIARSQTDIQSTMHKTLSGTEAGLIAYWPLNESGTNTMAYECVGGNNGELMNFDFSNDGWLPATDLSLPVQAAEFVAKSEIGSVVLSWKTRSESENAGFEILRKDPGSGESKLVTSYLSNNSLKGLGTSTTGRTYQFVDDKVKCGATYDYTIRSVSTSGSRKDLTTLSVSVDVPTSYALFQNYPNPFNPSTTIRFDIKQISTVTLEIYNTLGQRVDHFDYGTMDAGRYNRVVDMSHYASGLYYYRLTASGNNGESFVSTKRLMLVK